MIKNNKQYSSSCFDHRRNTLGNARGGILIVVDMKVFTTNSLIYAWTRCRWCVSGHVSDGVDWVLVTGPRLYCLSGLPKRVFSKVSALDKSLF